MKADKLIKRNAELIEQFGSSNLGVVNLETGEIEQEIPYGSKLVPPKTKYIDVKGVKCIKNFIEKEMFVKMYKNPIEILGKELTNRDFAWFMRLTPYVEQTTCSLVNEKGEYLNIKEISELLNVNYDNAKTVFRSFDKLDLIHKIEKASDKNKYKKVIALTVNPYIFFNGKHLAEDVYESFKNTKWADLNKNKNTKN